MPRYYWKRKNRVEEYRSLSISFFRKEGYLREGASPYSGRLRWVLGGNETSTMGFDVSKDDTTKEWYIRVTFSKDAKEWQGLLSFDYKIRIVATVCNYWGLRWWFIDPCHPEERKCCILYLQNNGYFSSRKTMDLSYDSQSYNRRWFWWAQLYSLKALHLREKIKYTFRNGKPTKKMRRMLKYWNKGLQEQWYRQETDLGSILLSPDR